MNLNAERLDFTLKIDKRKLRLRIFLAQALKLRYKETYSSEVVRPDLVIEIVNVNDGDGKD